MCCRQAKNLLNRFAPACASSSPRKRKPRFAELCAQADPNITHSFYEFFAGSGMARVGLGPVNWRCAFANNFDHKKGQSYRANFGANDLRVADVAALQWVDDIHR